MAHTQSMVLVTKASGERVPFSKDKLRQSLQRSGASADIIEMVTQAIDPYLHEGISTKEIYKLAFSLLRKKSKSQAARYKLKQGIMELGPSGFPFERFVAEILRRQGFVVDVGIVVKGHCVSHEVDVVAHKGNKHFMVECKFHNTQGMKSDVKVPLYIAARFKDIEQHCLTLHEPGSQFHQGWVVTNTKFTNDAIHYGTCAGLHLLGWDFPRKGGLKDQIDQFGLYPLTCLTTLTKAEKQALLSKKIVLCSELLENKELLNQAGIPQGKIISALSEAHALCARRH